MQAHMLTLRRCAHDSCQVASVCCACDHCRAALYVCSVKLASMLSLCHPGSFDASLLCSPQKPALERPTWLNVHKRCQQHKRIQHCMCVILRTAGHTRQLQILCRQNRTWTSSLETRSGGMSSSTRPVSETLLSYAAMGPRSV